ncbi:MAG: hypothetical protein WBK56_04025 [Methanoculleus sp.]
MVLEEILTIYDPIDTPKIARAFKEAGMPARVTQTVTLKRLVSAKGAIKDIKTLLREEIARLRKLAEEFRGEGDTEEDEPLELYDPYLDVTERIAKTIAEFMERFPPGDVIPKASIEEWMNPSGRPASGAPPPGDKSATFYKFMALATLGENGLIEVGDEGMVVKQYVDPEDVVLTLPGGLTEDVAPDVFAEHGIQAEVTIVAVPECRLEFGPRVILGADLDKVDEIADALDIDEDAYISFREGISLKQIVVAKTMEILEEGRTLTPPEVGRRSRAALWGVPRKDGRSRWISPLGL